VAAVDLEVSALRSERLDLCGFGIDWLLPAAQWRWDRVAAWQTPLPWVAAPAA